MNAQSPIVSEFETTEKAEAYEAWLRAKVTASLADDSPSVSHDEAMSVARQTIEKRRGAKARLAR
ncbi:MAG: stability determinant [Sphingorhabdus sp.]